MGFLGSSRRLPARLRPPLAPDERVLAHAQTSGGEAIVVTNQGIWTPGEPRERLEWHEIHKASWENGRLTVTPAVEVSHPPGFLVMADGEPMTFRLAEPGDVPARVRERVTRSVARTEYHQLPPGGGVRIAARRVAGVDGLRWTARFDAGSDPDDPSVLAATADLVRAVSGND